ncbi:MAG: hypothetical protein WDA21_00355, partial [Bacilli bacterium]
EKEITYILNEQKYEISYPLENSIMYCKIIVENILSGDDTDRINNLSSDKFYIELICQEEKTNINIHKNSVF